MNFYIEIPVFGGDNFFNCDKNGLENVIFDKRTKERKPKTFFSIFVISGSVTQEN